MYKGTGYLGSPALMESKANEEVITKKPDDWSQGYVCYKFEFDNDQDCTVTINGKNTIFIRAGRGFITTPEDAPITSFVIKEPRVAYTWAAAY